MKRIPLALALFLVFASAAAAQEGQGDTVPFELEHGKIVVKAMVNGKGPYRLVVSTAQASVVLREVDSSKPGTVAVGKAEVRGVNVLQDRRFIEFDGTIGYEFLSNFVVTIDYGKQTLRLDPLPPVTGDPYIGMSPRAIGADEANEIGIDGGVVVHKIAKGSPAEKGGLKEKDIIQEMNGKRIDTVDDYYAVVKKSKPGETITFTVIRDKKDVEVRVVVGAKK